MRRGPHGRRRTWLTCNWLVIGLACASRGHVWRSNRVASLELTDCSRCGKFRGWRRMDERSLRGQR